MRTRGMWSEFLEVQVLNVERLGGCVRVGRHPPCRQHAIFDHDGKREETDLWDDPGASRGSPSSDPDFPFPPRSHPARTNSHVRRRPSQQCVTNLTEREQR